MFACCLNLDFATYAYVADFTWLSLEFWSLEQLYTDISKAVVFFSADCMSSGSGRDSHEACSALRVMLDG